jgi:hypothetical protein
MIQTITINDFIRAFEQMGRAKAWSTAGLSAVFDHLEECEDPNHPMELDVVGIDCEFVEYPDITALKNDYSVPEDCEDDDEALDYFRDETLVLELPNGGLVIQSY